MNRPPNRTAWLSGKRALVMGLGTRQGGLGVARFLAAAGAEVLVTDLRGPDALRESLDQLTGLPIRFRLGEHRAEDFEAADFVVRNPGVPADSPWLQLARAHGAAIEMEMSLFFRVCPAPIVGVTGTKGKTTTSILCAGMLREWRSDTVLAGNMGRSALEMIPQIQPETPVVIELSSWQLEGLAEHGLGPHIAVWTNVSQDHLNRYTSFEAYIDAKRQIARFQGPGDWFVVNRDDPVVWDSRTAGLGTPVPFGIDDGSPSGAFLAGDRLVWRWQGTQETLATVDELPIPGRHAAINALAAAAAALLRGADVEQVRQGLLTSEPVEHRQETVATIGGVRYVNDTAATAPAAVLAALETFRDQPIVLIAGGSEKHVELDEMAQRAAEQAKAIVLLDGAATAGLERLLRAAGAPVISGPHRSMAAAVDAAAGLAQPGGVVLLSPGCASFGMFEDEFQRGRAFRAAVQDLSSRSLGEVRA